MLNKVKQLHDEQAAKRGAATRIRKKRAATHETPIKPRLLDEHDAAIYIGMSVAFLRLDRCEGHRGNRTPGPDYVKIGKSVRYDLDCLNAWIDAHKRARVS